MATGAEPMRAPGWELFAEWHALIESADPRFTWVGNVNDAAEAVARLAAQTTISAWNMQRHNTIDDLGDPRGLDADSRRKGLELRYILPRRVAEVRSPLVSSYYSYLRLAPVAHPLIVSDRRRILVGDATGETIWTSTDRGVVDGAVRRVDDDGVARSGSGGGRQSFPPRMGSVRTAAAGAASADQRRARV